MTDADDCWLGYRTAPPERRERYVRRCAHAYVPAERPEHGVVRDELRRGLAGLLGREPHLYQHPPRAVDGFLAVGARHEMAIVREAVAADEIEGLHEAGYVIRATNWEGQDCLVVTAATDRGLVYGTFDLLRRLSTGADVDSLDVVSEPAYEHRLVNHWDDPFRRSVERGYAGLSIFDWERLPDLRPRYREYARLLASVGVNGIVVNNVNTQKPAREGENDAVATREGWQLLRSGNLPKVAALADLFRRYGIATYLSVNYAAPMFVGGLETADPLDGDVETWWTEKVAEVYEHVPDFGGFLVKADSEGQPGPYDYDRSHAEGANVLGRAFEGHPGRVFWRAFVYSDHDDRAVEAYETFEPLDGDFHEKVTLQVKNGPIDFQPREPVSPLFGAMPETNLACELQIAGEYTGQGVHCTSHLPIWTETLEFDTHADGPGTPVTDVLRGEGHGGTSERRAREGQGIAGVAGVGEDPTWTGHPLLQSNLYGFGRLLWDPDLSVKSILREWAEQTFGADEEVVETVTGILLDSYPAAVNYTTGGLGLIHMMYNGEDVVENHYDPSPREWPEYVRADEHGVGVDRSSSGSGYVQQYADPVAERFDDPETCPEELLLFFHHLPWEHELADGTTVIQRLYDNLFTGVETVRDMRERWARLEGRIDERRHRHVAERLEEQVLQAERWRDALCEFFYEHAGVPDDEGRLSGRD